MTATTLLSDFYARGKTAGVYPALTTRRDEAYVEFIEDARNLLLHAQQDPIAGYSRKLLEDAGIDADPGEENTDRATKLLMADPALQSYYRVKRSLQESFWGCIQASYDSRRADLERCLDDAEQQGPGTLEYDPDWAAPAYAEADIHLQPGGYLNDTLAGLYYDYGLKVFLGGSADDDKIFKQIAWMTGAPEDGNAARVLDLGCSAGGTTTALAQQFPEAEVIGIDVSAPMLRYAHLRAIGQEADVHFQQMSAEQLDYPDDHFDAVLAMLLFHEVPVPAGERILDEIYRVLRPGGVLTVIDFPGDRWRDVYTMFFAAMDATDNGEPFLPAYIRSNVEDVMVGAGFEVKPYDPSKFLLTPRIGIKPAS
jgi:SAM-dependent methyltransferase